MLSSKRVLEGRPAALLVSHISRLGLCKDKSSLASHANSSQEVQMADVKPYSAIPTDTHHWLATSFQLFFCHGGIQRSMYKIQEKLIKQCGPISRMASPIGDNVLLADPNDVQRVLRAEPKYPKRFKVPMFDDFYERHKRDPGVFFLNGEKWRKHKMIIGKKMLRPPEINRYIPSINSIASEMIERIRVTRNPLKSDRASEVDDVALELFKWSFETVADFLFDRRFNSLSKNPPAQSVEFIMAIGKFLESIIKVSLFPPIFYRYVKTKAFKEFDHNFLLLYKIAEKLIDERIENVEQPSGLIPFLLSTDIAEDEIGSSIVDTFFAGVDTTSNTMQWMLYLLAKHPEKQASIREEILSVVGNEEQLDEAALKNMPLVRSAIRETLRLYPVLITTGRVLPTDIVLSGYNVPANTSIFFMHHGMGRREDIFENANSFVPERWQRAGLRSDVNAFASIPFGFGVRMCLGRRLAELELQFLLIKILQNFTLEIPPEYEVLQCMRGTNIPGKPIRVKFVDIV